MVECQFASSTSEAAVLLNSYIAHGSVELTQFVDDNNRPRACYRFKVPLVSCLLGSLSLSLSLSLLEQGLNRSVSEQEIEDESMPKPMVPQSMLTSSMVSILEVPPIEIAKQLTILEHGSSRSSLLLLLLLLLLVVVVVDEGAIRIGLVLDTISRHLELETMMIF